MLALRAAVRSVIVYLIDYFICAYLFDDEQASIKEQKAELEDQLRHDVGILNLLKQQRLMYLTTKSPVNVSEFHSRVQSLLGELMNLREMEKCGRVIPVVAPKHVLGTRQPFLNGPPPNP